MLTKRDLQQALFQLKDELKRELKQELGQDILQFKDEILFEIKGIREELAIVVGYRDRIEDHEERIEKLENVSQHQIN